MEGPTIAATRPAPDVEALVKRSGSSFYWAMRLLPKTERDAMFAVYAFCRSVDDIADGPLPPEEKRSALDAWQAEIDGVYDGRAQSSVGTALIAAVERYGLAREDFIAVIEGMRMDAVSRLRLADMAELALYCDRVACAVGRLAVRIFGLERETGLALAKSLGEALQLTNILRDVDEDAARDHVYLPRALLGKHGVDTDDAMEMLDHPAFPTACEELAGLAHGRFTEAKGHMDACDPKAVRPAAVMMTVYGRHLDRLMARGWAAPRRAVDPGKAQKLLIAVGTTISGAVGWR